MPANEARLYLRASSVLKPVFRNMIWVLATGCVVLWLTHWGLSSDHGKFYLKIAVFPFLTLCFAIYGTFLVAARAALGYPRYELIYPIHCQYSQFACWLNGIQVEVREKHLLDQHRPCVFVGNHQTYLDGYLTWVVFPKQTVSVVKDSLKRWPLVGVLLALAGTIFVKRGSKYAIEALRTAAIEMHHKKVSLR